MLEARIIKAQYTDRTIRVYQAFSREIAEPALETGKFVAPFKMSRMTWIKPSFNWMMYRSAYGTKTGQEFVLAIDILRDGFDWALANAVLSKYRPELHDSIDSWKRQLNECPVRVQWDPARNWRLGEVANERSIQIGLSRTAVCKYVDEWIVSISDVTPIAHSILYSKNAKTEPSFKPGDLEEIYPVNESVKWRLRMS